MNLKSIYFISDAIRKTSSGPQQTWGSKLPFSAHSQNDGHMMTQEQALLISLHIYLAHFCCPSSFLPLLPVKQTRKHNGHTWHILANTPTQRTCTSDMVTEMVSGCTESRTHCSTLVVKRWGSSARSHRSFLEHLWPEDTLQSHLRSETLIRFHSDLVIHTNPVCCCPLLGKMHCVSWVSFRQSACWLVGVWMDVWEQIREMHLNSAYSLRVKRVMDFYNSTLKERLERGSSEFWYPDNNMYVFV